MKRANPKVDAFLRKAPKWRQEFERLRKILLASPLTEGIKWRLPCYSLEGNNVAIVQGFKEYFALGFFQGALLKDPKRILITQTENVQASRQIRFTDVRHFWRNRNRIAEISVPAWPMPTQKTKFVMSNAQPTVELRPQVPTPFTNR